MPHYQIEVKGKLKYLGEFANTEEVYKLRVFKMFPSLALSLRVMPEKPKQATLRRPTNRWAIRRSNGCVLFLLSNYSSPAEVSSILTLRKGEKIVYIPRDTYHRYADAAFTRQLFDNT